MKKILAKISSALAAIAMVIGMMPTAAASVWAGATYELTINLVSDYELNSNVQVDDTITDYNGIEWTVTSADSDAIVMTTYSTSTSGVMTYIAESDITGLWDTTGYTLDGYSLSKASGYGICSGTTKTYDDVTYCYIKVGVSSSSTGRVIGVNLSLSLTPEEDDSVMITYNVDGVESTEDVTAGESYTITKTAEKEGYDFLGWSDTEGTIYANYLVERNTYTFDEDITLYAVFYEQIEADLVLDPILYSSSQKYRQYYFVRYFIYHKNDPTSDEDETYVIKQFSEGKSLGLSKRSNYYNNSDADAQYDCGFELPDGYEFIGWNTEADGSGTSYAEYTDYVSFYPGRNDLYATYNKLATTYTLTYVSDDETYAAESADSTESTYTFTITEDEPSKEGYTFGGWADEDGNIYNAGDSITLSEDAPSVSLTAVWSVITWNVTYVDARGETITSETVEYGGSVTIADITVDAPGGQYHAGWTTTEDWDEADSYELLSVGDTVEVTGDVTFYPVFLDNEVEESEPETPDRNEPQQKPQNQQGQNGQQNQQGQNQQGQGQQNQNQQGQGQNQQGQGQQNQQNQQGQTQNQQQSQNQQNQDQQNLNPQEEDSAVQSDSVQEEQETDSEEADAQEENDSQEADAQEENDSQEADVQEENDSQDSDAPEESTSEEEDDAEEDSQDEAESGDDEF